MKLRKTICLLLFVHCAILLPAQQTFEKVYGGPGSDVAIRVFNAGTKYFIAGTTTSGGAGSYDACLIQTDTFGNVLTATSAGSFGEDVIIAATMTKYRDFLMAGYTNSFGGEHPLLMKFDQYGAFVWAKVLTIPGWAQGITADLSGNLYVTGYVSGNDIDVFLAKYDSSGSLQWGMSCGDTLLNEGRAVVASKDGTVFVSGTTHVHAGGPTDSFVFKTDSLGNLLWSYSYAVPGFNNWDIGYALKELGNEIILGGLSYSEAFNQNPNSPDAIVVILDSLGSVKKGLAMGSTEYDDLRSLAIKDDGSICLAGATNFHTNGNTDLLYICFDTLGTILQQKQFGGSTFDHGLCLEPLNHGRILLSGYSESFGSGQEDIYFIKSDSSALTCNAGIGTLSILPIQITQKEVFDPAAINIGSTSPVFISQSILLTEQSLCSPTKVPESSKARALRFYPNPFVDEITLEMQEESEKIISISLLDLTGKTLLKVLSPALSNENYKLSTQSVPSGAYILVIEFSRSTSAFKLLHK